MLDNNEEINIKEDLNISEDRNCNEGCCKEKPLNSIPTYSYEFSKSENDENESCEEIKESRKELINKIRSLDFAIVELAEYLDTHNTDKNALKLHKEYATALH